MVAATHPSSQTTRALLSPFRELGLAFFWKSRWPAVCEKRGPNSCQEYEMQTWENLAISRCYIFSLSYKNEVGLTAQHFKNLV